ncbi:hypothetical protein SAMN04515672_2251 [Natronorubrum texcoconense]|uniref:Uncharacterized protein n=1 Tax=Natronorubrum texcoconense TaxID=1095776 RepID=A0A1G8YPH7_9EURY|nr:hypothetical protein SAMN04515672_2251 [Natronorubrum texcoconense]
MTNLSDDSSSNHDSEEDVLHSEDSTHPRIELLHHIAAEIARCSAETAVYAP